MNKTDLKKVRLMDRFVFKDRDKLNELLELLEVAKYERLYLSKHEGVWHVTVIWPWLVDEESHN